MADLRWKRPRTLKTYLQAPLAQRIVMLWPDFKVTNYEFTDNGKHTGQKTSGLILLHNGRQLDYERSAYRMLGDGVPVYSLCNDIGGSVEMEALCDFERNPGVYVKITLKNNHAYSVSGSVELLARSGEDQYLTAAYDTGYSSYKPNVGLWCLLKNNWMHEGLKMSDGYGYVVLQPSGNLSTEWVEHNGASDKFASDRYFRMTYALEPGEEAVCYVSQKIGAYIENFDYEKQREQTVVEWHSILSDIRKVPDTDNLMYKEAFLYQVSYSLQMLARYPDQEWAIPRQGDVGCYVWPWEAVQFLIPLDRIGLWKHTGDAYWYFMKKWFVDAPGEPDDGKIIGKQQWANLNGSLIWGISEHLLCTKDTDEFQLYKPYLDRMLGWIEREREKSFKDGASILKGVFPAGKSCDWEDNAQFWIFTDATNLQGLRSMVQVYEHYEADNATAVRQSYESYHTALMDVFRMAYEGHQNDEMFTVPHRLDVPFEDTETMCYSIIGQIYLYETGILDPCDKHFEQMERFFVNRGFHHNGLTGRMTNCSDGIYGLYSEMYYTVVGEKTWISAWKARGETEKAKATFDALMEYCLTPEYIVSERYSPDDEWFSPWQPNASGGGRVMTTMLDYFGERSN